MVIWGMARQLANFLLSNRAIRYFIILMGGSMFRFVLVLILMMLASPVWAISFDIWKTGLSRQEIVSLAQQQNLALAKNRVEALAKSFNLQLVSGETESFCYNTKLLEQPAFVQLLMTPRKGGYEQYLYEIDIQFSKKADLRSYLIKLLEEKYGVGSPKFDIIRKILVWHPEPDNVITLITTPALLQLTYTDTKIKSFAEKLRKTTYDLPKSPASHTDAKRF